MTTPMLPPMLQANDAAVAISAGANHVLLVHRSGQLYTWGVGASGRLGLDLSQGGNPQVTWVSRATICLLVPKDSFTCCASCAAVGQIMRP